MDCPWKRTLASVFLLLSSHNVRVLSQNVGPTGPLPPLPLLRDCAGQNLGPRPQQMNLYASPPNSMQKEYVPLGPYAPEFQVIPDFLGPVYPQALPFNSVPQGNVGFFPLDPGYNIPQITNLLPLQGVYNPLTNINVLPSQGLPFNALPSSLPMPLSPSFSIPPITNIAPLQGPSPYIPFAPIQQGQTFINPPVTNLPFPQGFQSNISPIPMGQGHIVPSPVGPPVIGPARIVPPNVQNQNVHTYPTLSTSYTQPVAGAPCTLTTDLTSMSFLPSPNLPTAIPIKNCVHIPQSPIQPMVYPQSIVSVDYSPNTPVSPNYQISDLPPVFPSNMPQLFENSGGNCQKVAEEYSPVPINVQINVPSPTIPEPKITIITAYPSAPAPPAAVNSDSSEVSFGMFPSYPLPPIIIDGRRSRSRSWLPLFLIALFARDGFGGGGGCCCCCPCKFASADMPIPYPIPIPTNNPIIVGNSCGSRKKGAKSKTSGKKND